MRDTTHGSLFTTIQLSGTIIDIPTLRMSPSALRSPSLDDLVQGGQASPSSGSVHGNISSFVS
jgi:hypothetical protein